LEHELFIGSVVGEPQPSVWACAEKAKRSEQGIRRVRRKRRPEIITEGRKFI
jgi:hypothetical protein